MVSIKKSGIVYADGSAINENLCTWGYSKNPYFPNTAGSTILSVTQYDDFTRYTATTAGTDGGKYGYPRGGGTDALIQGTVYTWSAEFRSNVAITFNRGRIGFEGGGMLGGNVIKIGTDWTRITNTWTQTTSKAFVFYPCGDLANGNYIDIRNLKLEVGSVATPFTIPSSETARYVGEVHGFVENSTSPLKLGGGYIQANEINEI